MIGKILLTLAVIVLAVVYLRKRAAMRRLEAAARQQQAAPQSQVDQFLTTAASQASRPSADSRQLNRTLRWLLWSLALLAVLSGSLYTYHRWQDNNRELTILLYRDGDTAPVVYRVPRHSLGDRSFVTHDGVQVTVSASERMEVIGL